MDSWSDWPRESGGTDLASIRRIQTVGLVGLPWAPQICNNYFHGADLRSPIEMAAAQPRPNSPYPELYAASPNSMLYMGQASVGYD